MQPQQLPEYTARLVAFLRTEEVVPCHQRKGFTLLQIAKAIGMEADAVPARLEEAAALQLVNQVDKRHWRANRIPETREERLAYANKRLLATLERALEDARKARKELLEALAAPETPEKEYGMLRNMDYMLRWAEGTAQVVAKATVAHQILYTREGAEQPDLIARTREALKELEHQLLGGSFRATSSSMFSNATELAKAQALSDLYRDLQTVIRCIDSDEAKAPAIEAQEQAIHRAAIELAFEAGVDKLEGAADGVAEEVG